MWNGVSLLFTDWTRTTRMPHGAAAEVGAESLRTEHSTATETGYEAAADGRSGWLSNGLLGLVSALFVVLLVVDISNRIS